MVCCRLFGEGSLSSVSIPFGVLWLGISSTTVLASVESSAQLVLDASMENVEAVDMVSLGRGDKIEGDLLDCGVEDCDSLPLAAWA